MSKLSPLHVLYSHSHTLVLWQLLPNALPAPALTPFGLFSTQQPGCSFENQCQIMSHPFSLPSGSKPKCRQWPRRSFMIWFSATFLISSLTHFALATPASSLFLIYARPLARSCSTYCFRCGERHGPRQLHPSCLLVFTGTFPSQYGAL